MNKKWKVCSKERAKGLVDLGVVLKTEMYWCDSHLCTYKQAKNWNINFGWEIYPAPDVTELSMLLPRIIKDQEDMMDDIFTPRAQLWMRKTGKDEWLVGYFDMEDQSRWFAYSHVQLAESISINLAWLIEDEHVDINQLSTI